MVVQHNFDLSSPEDPPTNFFPPNLRYKPGENILAWLRKISCDGVTPAYVLKELALSSDPEFRIIVADDANTSEEVLLWFVEDDDPDVRYALAENHNISQRVLKRLCDDSNPYVAHRAEKTLKRLGVDDLLSAQLQIDSSPALLPLEVVRHSDAELECKRLLTMHSQSSKPDNATVVTWLHRLAQALEGQGRYVEALDSRLHARDMMISIMDAS
jgi:hypothetical protein